MWCSPVYAFTSASATFTFVFQTVPENDLKLYSGDDVISVLLQFERCPQPLRTLAIITDIMIRRIGCFILSPPNEIQPTEYPHRHFCEPSASTSTAFHPEPTILI